MIAALLLVTQIALCFNDVTAAFHYKETIGGPEVTAVTPESLRITWHATENQCVLRSVTHLIEMSNGEMVSTINLPTKLGWVEFTGLQQCTGYTLEIIHLRPRYTLTCKDEHTPKRMSLPAYTTSDTAVYNVTAFSLNATSINVSWVRTANNCYDSDQQTMLTIETAQKVIYSRNHTNYKQHSINVTNLTPDTSYKVSLFTVFKGGNLSFTTWNTIVQTPPGKIL